MTSIPSVLLLHFNYSQSVLLTQTYMDAVGYVL
jgi:hypothetical protein